MIEYDIPRIFSGFPNLIAAQSTRLGGSSFPPYNSLNLGLNTDDAPKTVEQNRRQFFSALGFSEHEVVGAYQVHGTRIHIATKPEMLRGYDAFITQKKGLLLSVTIADCVPVLIYDSGNQVVAAIHSGWKGTARKITTATLQKMTADFGTKPADCFVYIGTSICAKTFEVDEDVAQYFSASYKYKDEARQKYLIDLRRHNHDQLLAQGVLPENIEVSTHSTVLDNNRYFSYRKEKGTTGRMLAVIGLI